MRKPRLEIFEEHWDEIEKYCVDNNLSADKVYESACCCNYDRVFYQHYTPPKEGEIRYIGDYTKPAPVTLKVFLEDGKLRFEQTDVTYKYLSPDEPAREAASARERWGAVRT
jgi:hypothetical protein